MIETDRIGKIYEEILPDGRLVLPEDDPQMMYIRSFLPESKRARILDAGCGNGQYALQLCNDGYKNIYAVDLFDKIDNNGYCYLKASIGDLPFGSFHFDFICCNSVIYYLSNPELGIAEFNRVLKEGGVLFMTAHTKYSHYTLSRLIRRHVLPHSVRHLEGVEFYSAKQYSDWAEKNGLEILLVDGFHLRRFGVPCPCHFFKSYPKFTRKRLPIPKYQITRSKTVAKFKSVFGYHSIIVARKKSNERF